MPDFTTKMLTARSVALGERDKREVAQELGVAVQTVEGWVRSYKAAAVREKARIGEVKAAPVKKATAKPKKPKVVLPEPEKVQEPTPTKPAPVAKAVDDDDDFFF